MKGAKGSLRPTLADVARTAGVAVGTASMVLSGKGDLNRISEETQRRVHEAAAGLRYAPSLLHRSLQRGRTRILAFYSGFRTRKPDDLYMNRLSAAIEAAGGHHRYNILAYCDYEQSARETFDFLSGGFVDGVVMVGAHVDDPFTALLRESRLPTVVIDPAESEPVLSTVRTDDRPGMDALAEALARNGHRRIAGIVARPPNEAIGRWRCDRFRDALERKRGGSPVRWSFVEGETPRGALERALALPERPTAIFAWHDWLAYEILEACHERGIDVPGELSIVGYDGIVWPSKTAHVVTSVGVPPEALAEAALGALVRLVEGAPGPLREVVPVSLVPGTTLGPASPSPPPPPAGP